jgi:threonine dehydratase
MTTLSALARDIAASSQLLAAPIQRYALITDLVEYRAAGENCGSTLLVKSEHQQRTGSFKLRGALSKLLQLDDAQRRRGLVTSSTGNHGLGVARALHELGGRGVICVPEGASPVKLAALSRFDVEIRTMGREAAETEALARSLAGQLSMTYISPYNDFGVIAGQGTVGQEIIQQLGGRAVDAVVVSVGGGGLISGVAASVKAACPGTRVIGASPANDAAMAASVRAGKIIEIDAAPTISDGTAGGLEPGSITFDLCRELVDDWVLVEEEDIYAALRLVIDTEHQLIEGAAAVAVAAALQVGARQAGQTLAVVSCGANISSATLATAISRPGANGKR